MKSDLCPWKVLLSVDKSKLARTEKFSPSLHIRYCLLSFKESYEKYNVRWASQVALVVRSPPANVGDLRDTDWIPGSGRSPGRGRGNPLQCSCLENPMDRRAWQVTVHSVMNSGTGLMWQHACMHSATWWGKKTFDLGFPKATNYNHADWYRISGPSGELWWTVGRSHRSTGTNFGVVGELSFRMWYTPHLIFNVKCHWQNTQTWNQRGKVASPTVIPSVPLIIFLPLIPETSLSWFLEVLVP